MNIDYRNWMQNNLNLDRHRLFLKTILFNFSTPFHNTNASKVSQCFNQPNDDFYNNFDW